MDSSSHSNNNSDQFGLFHPFFLINNLAKCEHLSSDVAASLYSSQLGNKKVEKCRQINTFSHIYVGQFRR